MFERNRVDNLDQGTIMIEAIFDDGLPMIGRLSLPQGRTLLDFMNGASTYVEFEPLDEARRIVAKSSIKGARAIAPPRTAGLNQRLRDLDAFDPHQILGLERGVAWDEVRAAYHRLAKAYHPDRYATAELPDEVIAYLSGMARRVNAAYATIETAYAQKRAYAKHRQEPIYTSPART